MFYEIEEKFHDKTQRLNNPETNVLTHDRFNTHFILLLKDLNKAQIFEIRYRVSQNQEVGIVMSFNYLNLFQPNEHREVYHIREPND